MKAGVRYTVKVKSRRSLQAEANLTPFITLVKQSLSGQRETKQVGLAGPSRVLV